MHRLANGRAVNLPSFLVKPGDAVGVKGKSQEQLRIKEALALAQDQDSVPSWCELDASKFSGVFKALPDRSDLSSAINENLIVEVYSK